jgi:tRNA threonylcarbamoyladenosine biosynthesis protein TsaB
MILCLETATTTCSVALCDRKQVIITLESDKDKSHASALTILISEVLKKACITASDLEAVAVSKGPGSYTGLRIGVSTAKGISFASSIPLIGIDTTISMFYGFTNSIRDKYVLNDRDLFCPVLDARRMEVYYSVINYEGIAVRSTSAEIITQDSFSDLSPESRIFLFGNGAEKCRKVVTRGNIIFYDDFRLSASFMQIPAYEALKEKRFEDVAYFEPFYLKDFLTSKPVKNILNK